MLMSFLGKNWGFFVVTFVLLGLLGAAISLKIRSNTQVAFQEMEFESQDLSAVKVGQILTNGVEPVGLQLSTTQAIFFPTPRAKLATEPTAFQAAVGSGISSFLITTKELSWQNSCHVFANLGEGMVAEVVDLSGRSPDSDWEVCWLGEPLDQRLVIQTKRSWDTSPESSFSVWFAAPLHEVGAVEELKRVVDGTSLDQR